MREDKGRNQTMIYPYSQPYLDDNDKSEVLSVLQGQYLTQGPVVDRLEEALTSMFSVKHAVVCNSGTAALHLTYLGLGLGPNAGLVTSAITFLSTANAARMCNAPVGFADVDPKTGNVTLETIMEAVASAPFKVRAISVVHLGGRPCDVCAIREYANSIGAYLVEDACHAPMAKYSSKLVNALYTVGSCSHSDVATLSFHAIKHITAGEGGVVLTNSDELAEQSRLLRSHGMVRDLAQLRKNENANAPWYYEMQRLGYNYRLSDINCALAINQIPRLEININRRQRIAELYYKYLAGLEYIDLPEKIFPSHGVHAWHLFAPRFDFKKIGKSRSELMRTLADRGVGTQVHYIPLYRQPYYQHNAETIDFVGSESYYQQTLSLPMYYGLNDADVSKIAQIIRSVVDK